MHADVDGLSAARDDFRLTISTTKTEVMLQLTPGKSGEPHIQVKGCNFKAAKILPIPLQHSKYWCGGQHAHIWSGDPPPKKKKPYKAFLKDPDINFANWAHPGAALSYWDLVYVRPDECPLLPTELPTFSRVLHACKRHHPAPLNPSPPTSNP